MGHTSRLLLSTSFTLVVGAMMVTEAAAGAFALKERSARAQGLSFAGATSGSGGITSMTFNPAVIGIVEHAEMGGGLSYISPISDGKVVNSFTRVPTGETVDADRHGLVANGAFGYRFGEDFLIGVSSFTPFGLSTQYPQDWTGSGDGITSKLTTLNVSPTFAYQPFDNLTFAVTYDVLYADARLTSSDLVLDGDEISHGFSAGVLWQPTATTTIGAAYQHGHDLRLSGRAEFGAGALAGLSLPADAAAELPATVSVGITQGILPELRVMGEFQWQNWSVFDKIDTTVQSPIGAIALSDPQNYEDAFFVAAGVEYDVIPSLTLRGGIAWDETPTVDSNFLTGGAIAGRTVRTPDEDRLWFSFGATYYVTEDMAVDFGYSYLTALDDPVVDLRTAPGNSVIYDGGAHIVSIGGSLKF